MRLTALARAVHDIEADKDPGIYAQRPSSGADKSWGSRPVGRSKKRINCGLEGAEAGPKTRICTGYAVKPSEKNGYLNPGSNHRLPSNWDARQTIELFYEQVSGDGRKTHSSPRSLALFTTVRLDLP